MLGRECHAAYLNADTSVSARRLMGGRLCQSQAHTGDQCRRSQGECFHTEIPFDVRKRIHANPEAERAFVRTNSPNSALFLLAIRLCMLGYFNSLVLAQSTGSSISFLPELVGRIRDRAIPTRSDWRFSGAPYWYLPPVIRERETTVKDLR